MNQSTLKNIEDVATMKVILGLMEKVSPQHEASRVAWENLKREVWRIIDIQWDQILKQSGESENGSLGKPAKS